MFRVLLAGYFWLLLLVGLMRVIWVYCVVAVWVVFGLVGHLVISCGVCECLVLMVVVWFAVDWCVGYEC